MYGNGRPGPMASGVRTGKICSRKWRSMPPASASASAQVTIRIPFSASAGRMTSVYWREWRRSWALTGSAIPSSVSVGDRPSGPRASIRASTWSWTPATRIMKNSSRLVTKMARNFTRSSSGSDSSSASWSTRSLKSSHDSSRLVNSDGSESSRVAGCLARGGAGLGASLARREPRPEPAASPRRLRLGGVAHPAATGAPAAAIAASSLGRASTTSSPLLIAARPPFFIRAWAPVRS